MNITVFSFTAQGAALCGRLCAYLEKGHTVTGYVMEKYGERFPRLLPYTGISPDFMAHHFHNSQMLIFIGATGIAVRKIAPHLKSKEKDPGVVVLDEKGRYCIPLLSGHLGGANEMALEIGAFTGATPVITTATDINYRFAVDIWAKKNGLVIHNLPMVKHISADLLDSKKIGLVSDFPISGQLPQGIQEGTGPESGIHISFYQKEGLFKNCLWLIPKAVSIGMGCRKGAEPQVLLAFFNQCMASSQIPLASVQNLATIDIKKDEPALQLLSKQYGMELIFYSSEELNQAEGSFSHSDFVYQTTGTGNICERAAVLAANNGTLIAGRTAGDGVTFAAAVAKPTITFHPGGII